MTRKNHKWSCISPGASFVCVRCSCTKNRSFSWASLFSGPIFGLTASASPKRGIGRDTVADLTGIAPSTLAVIRKGSRKNLRAMSERAILAIELDAVLNAGQVISAVKTWERIRWLMGQGFTKTELAQRLGYKRQIQFNRNSISARNAMKVERFYNTLRAGDPDLEEKDTLERFLGMET